MPDVLHSQLSADELHQPFHYIQSSDPGASGAGRWWLDTSDADAPVLKRRDATNSAWVTIADAAAVAAVVSHVSNTSNPHAVTKAQVGLGNVPNVDATDRANHTGTQSADTIVDGTTNRAYTAAEKTKLAGLTAGATQNQPDAYLLSRANHTGTQSLDTTTDSATRLAMTAAERSKLTGIAAGATVNDSDANLRNRSTHTGTQSADTITDGTTNKAFSAADEAKLNGIASGATANSSDAVLLNRANHTGVQDASSIGSGVIAPARLGNGTPSALNFLRGDGSWATPAGGGGGGGYEPSIDHVVQFDDFMGGGVIQGNIGNMGWIFAPSNPTYPEPPDGTARGMISMSTPASTAVTQVRLQGYESLTPDLDVTWRVRTGPNVSSVTYRVGLANAFTGTPTDGIYLESKTTDTAWFFVCRKNNVETRTAAGVSVVQNTWVKLRFRKIGSLVIFNINDGADVQIATNVPTGFAFHGFQIQSGNTTAKALLADYFQCVATNIGR